MKDYQSISIRDIGMLIRNTLNVAPKGLIAREALKNAVEAPTHLKEKERLIFLDAVTYTDMGLEGGDVAKLAISNSCLGLSKVDLLASSDMAASLYKNHSTHENRGEGLKVSSMRFSPEGLRLRSRKDGVIHEVVLYMRGDECVRQMVETAPGVMEAVYEPEVSESDAARYQNHFGSGDFYEVVFFGLTEGHATAEGLYSETGGGRGEVGFEIGSRFYDLPKHPTLAVKIVFDKFFRSAGHQAFRTFSEITSPSNTRLSKDFGHITDVTLENGIVIRYVECRLDNDNRTPYRTRSFIRDNRIAIEYRGEMYDVLEGQSWTKRAASFGLHGLAKTVSVIVRLPETMRVNDDRYRQSLERNGERISITDFAADVVKNRPAWVKDLQEAKFGDQDDIEAELQKFMDTRAFKANQDRVKGLITPRDEREKKDDEVGEKKEPVERSRPKARIKATSTGEPGRTRVKAPHIIWMRSDEDATLENRGGSFQQAPNNLLLNSEYPVLGEVIDALKRQAPGFDPANEAMEDIVTEVARKHVAFTVGSSVAVNVMRSGTEGWRDSEAQAKSLSSETLTTVYDTALNSIELAVKRLKSNRKWIEATVVANAA